MIVFFEEVPFTGAYGLDGRSILVFLGINLKNLVHNMYVTVEICEQVIIFSINFINKYITFFLN